MKMLSVSVSGLGVLAVILGLVGRFVGPQVILGVAPGGFIHGATALFLLALVIMAYDRWYCGKAPPPAKP